MNVKIQDKTVLKDFDIVKESGGVERDIVKIIEGVRVKDKLMIHFEPSELAPNSRAILSGIEIISDDLNLGAIGMGDK